MNRRKFIRNLSFAGASSLLLEGIPVNLLGNTNNLARLAANCDSDRVIVLIQLHGGNDGLNTLIPQSQYDLYNFLRPNAAIPKNGSRKYIELDNTLPDADRVGLHPDMSGIKSLYDEGKVAVVQGVGYPNLNQSHFRSRDIWHMGGDYDDYFGSGWAGRYLGQRFPGYPGDHPSDEMPDPPGLEIGDGVSLAFHRDNGIPAAISVRNPEQFYNLINGVGGALPDAVKESHYGEEMRWIMDIEQKSNEYAGRLKEVYEQGSNSDTTYPESYPFNAPAGSLNNPLSGQLKLIARLLSGGIKTKIFLTRIGGFDTHANQVESYDTSMGAHAALLYHISSAVKAYQEDLEKLGLEDKVLTMTFSEFGRRAESNGSYGTDHGKAAPMFLFGKGVNPGLTGTNPDLENLDNGNLRQQVDYRQVFTSVLTDWMCASDEAIQQVRFDTFLDQKVDVIDTSNLNTARQEFVEKRFGLYNCYPNPAKDYTWFTYYINNANEVSLVLFNHEGVKVKVIADTFQHAGTHEIRSDISDLPKGTYICRLKSGRFTDEQKLMIE